MKGREPLFRVVKKESVNRWKVALAYLIAIAAALLIGALLLSIMKVDALDFYKKMITLGIPGNKYPFRSVQGFISLFVPLLIVSMALALAFRRMTSPFGWAALSGLFGLTFGALCAIVYWIAGGWGAAVSWWLAGIPFDLIHGGGNFAIALVLFNPMRRLLARLDRGGA